MAWIESHQSLATHKKMVKLSRNLSRNRYETIGILHMFWWWALDNASNGQLDGIEPEDLAIAIQWDGEPNQLFDALVDCGWIEQDRKTIHDWFSYAGKLIEQRKQNAEKQRLWREKQRNQYITVMSPSCNGATVPNSTVPNHTNKENIIKEKFDAFWKCYPRKVAKSVALKSFSKINIDDNLFSQIMSKLEEYKKSYDWTKDNGQFIPHPATWLNQKRWEDEIISRNNGHGINKAGSKQNTGTNYSDDENKYTTGKHGESVRTG